MDGAAPATLLQANDFLWEENKRLRKQLDKALNQLRLRQQRDDQLALLQRRCASLEKHNDRLQRQVKELKASRLGRRDDDSSSSPQPPAFVKPDTQSKRRKTPGRKSGHAAALRPVPVCIDVQQTVPLPLDSSDDHPCCPECKTRLNNVRQHQRLVEDIVPSKVVTTCYHTTSGDCPHCRRRVESRAPEQPPAADLPHAQLGINALSTAAMMRVCYRMPLRQITGYFAAVMDLKLSPSGISKQLVRMSGWLDGQYHRLKLLLRAAGVVYADETGWRNDGTNAQLWTITNDTHTLYHFDKSRGAKVIADLLGTGFGADGRSTLVSDFYGVYDQFTDCAQQKCLAHLLRALKDTTANNPKLAGHAFFKRCRKLIKDMLALRDQREQLTPQVYQHRVELLERRLNQLATSSWNDSDDAQRLAARLRKHEGKLTTFLHNPRVHPTNNHAERALRPAVVMRKITGGNRSAKSAQAWAILASVMRTSQQQGRNVLETIQTLLKAHWAGKDITLLTDLLTPVEPNTS